jgi:hypothetical protein
MTQFPGRKGPFPAHDPDAWREAREIFGQAEASSRLRIFLDDLARDRKILETTPPDRCVAREIGHRTAARAGILGFPALARASADLDQAARVGAGIDATRAAWIAAADIVADIAPTDDPRAPQTDPA